MKRRLAAILVADVVGYSRLMEADEEGTAVRIGTCRQIAEAQIAESDGRLFKAMGDAVLAEFASPINAVRCAVGIRDTLALQERGHEQPLAMRFGLHLADVIVDGEDLIGDGVNLAARIQQEAEPGAIEISAALFDQIRRTSPYAFEVMSERRFKNIAKPIGIYKLKGDIQRNHYQITPTVSEPAVEIRPHSLAVLPIEVRGDNEEHHYLADGLAEEIIFELGRFRRLFVASRSASRTLKPEETDPQIAGTRLGVRYLLTGTVRPMGRKLRLSLALTETETGAQVWSDRMVEDGEDLIDRMDDLVSRIASTVLGRIEEADLASARRKKPESLTAYEFHLRGLAFHRLGGITDDNEREAVKWFQRAIEADPNFARPRAMLACAWSALPEFDFEVAVQSVQTALELDSHDPEANRIMGSIKLYLQEYPAARQYLERAASLSPSDAFIKGRLGGYHIFVGEPERALELLDEAHALNPFLPVWYVEERAVALYCLHRFDDVDAELRALPFQTRRSRLYRAAALVAMDDLDRAQQIVAEALVSTPDLTTAYLEELEPYKDAEVKKLLVNRVVQAGLPRFSPVAVAS